MSDSETDQEKQPSSEETLDDTLLVAEQICKEVVDFGAAMQRWHSRYGGDSFPVDDPELVRQAFTLATQYAYALCVPIDEVTIGELQSVVRVSRVVPAGAEAVILVTSETKPDLIISVYDWHACESSMQLAHRMVLHVGRGLAQDICGNKVAESTSH